MNVVHKSKLNNNNNKKTVEYKIFILTWNSSYMPEYMYGVKKWIRFNKIWAKKAVLGSKRSVKAIL